METMSRYCCGNGTIFKVCISIANKFCTGMRDSRSDRDPACQPRDPQAVCRGRDPVAGQRHPADGQGAQDRHAQVVKYRCGSVYTMPITNVLQEFCCIV